MKQFNTTGACVPELHYMVDISETVSEIKKYVDMGNYFTINRARQYGKTTTIWALSKILESDYVVVSIDFQDIEDGSFVNGGEFSKAFARILLDAKDFDGMEIPGYIADRLSELDGKPAMDVKMDDLFRIFRYWFREESRGIVLIIDEVDGAANNQVFLDFLAQLRSLYLKRLRAREGRTFQSVILAGVTDVRRLKAKIRDEGEAKLNSPWNIAADFSIDMSLSEGGIRGMLDEYEADHRTGMDTAAIAGQIREYTKGYPFLVSRICQVLDQKLCGKEPENFKDLSAAWSSFGVDQAVKLILSERDALFDSLFGKLMNFPELKEKLRSILLRGEVVQYVPDDEEQSQLEMYGFIYNNHNKVAISNRIFEMRLYAFFLGETSKNNDLGQLGAFSKNSFVDGDGWLNVPRIMERFIKEHNRIHEDKDEGFLEAEGRERFMTFVSAIINGTGTYSIEEETRDRRRMDLVIHYLGRRYIIEMKIWHGERYNEEGERQIMGYLDRFGLDTGYLLSFSFNKAKRPGVEIVHIGNKTIYEGIV